MAYNPQGAGERPNVMIVTYDPLLIALSIVIAIVGSYTGLRLGRRLVPKSGLARKGLLSGAAITIGGGIWSMHFVGMLAVDVPVTINYDVLLTLISALVSVLVTGIGLFIASYGKLTAPKLAVAGLLMGLGISTMHYVGMAAVRANFVMHYSGFLVAASVLIGIAASTLAVWLAFNLRGHRQTAAAAVVMGLAISGMHYTAMAAATFLPIDVLIKYSAPALSPHLLAIIVAMSAFLIFGIALLVALSDRPKGQSEQPQAETRPNSEFENAAPDAASANFAKIPVQWNMTTLLLDQETIVSVSADAHYTRIYDGNQSYFCSLSLLELESRLDPEIFMRVHRSYIVNLNHAHSFERRNEQGIIRLAGPAAPSVPVSRRNVPKLRTALGL